MHALKKLQTVFCVVVAALFAVEAAKASTFDLAGSDGASPGKPASRPASCSFGPTAKSEAIQAATASRAPTPRKTTR
jgi:hypothetical protein